MDREVRDDAGYAWEVFERGEVRRRNGGGHRIQHGAEAFVHVELETRTPGSGEHAVLGLPDQLVLGGDRSSAGGLGEVRSGRSGRGVEDDDDVTTGGGRGRGGGREARGRQQGDREATGGDGAGQVRGARCEMHSGY
ncbi:hypothetical protein ACQHIV_39155 [Kribbella sp. GL6]|uniref:hypothetical protein n=1 Tax=Kribbella sp. GL6 TaxID=3419765 RepID=UPI003D010E77